MIAAGFSTIFLCSLAPSLFNETSLLDFNETSLSDIGNHLSWDVLHSSTFKVTKWSRLKSPYFPSPTCPAYLKF